MTPAEIEPPCGVSGPATATDEMLTIAARPPSEAEAESRDVFAHFQQIYAGQSVAYRWVQSAAHGRIPELVAFAATRDRLYELLETDIRVPEQELRIWHVPAGARVLTPFALPAVGCQ